MGFKCGIVGLPNVGKSTLFNALTQTAAAEAANYPFCTIEPNVGDVGVPDPRLDQLREIAGSAAAIPTRLTFVDIAGLVRGASKGEGLGNQFLGHIREVDAVAYVLRCFEDPDVVHVEGRIDPVSDADTVETELMIADMESLERRRDPLEKKARSGDKDAKAQVALIDKALALVNAGKPARLAKLTPEEERPYRQLQLLTAKPVVYVCNVDEASIGGNDLSRKVEERAKAEGAGCVVISAKIEAEVAALEPEERTEYLEQLGLREPGLNALIREGYRVLNLITFFTVGPKEARAWTVNAGSKAAKAAGAIHTDFEKGFIRAETIAFDDFVTLGGELPAKQAGKMRLEGKEYPVKDGDVMLFRFAN
jgi:GTP-binding protein YchF